MGTPTILGKATTVVAITFMVTSFALSTMAHKRTVSIMPVSGPAAPAAPTAPPAGTPPAATPPAPQK
jgi:preprotein translocase subunit SecG